MSPEPPLADDPLLKLDNVIFTAHSGAISAESMVQLSNTPVEEIIAVLGGGWPRNFINPQVKEKYQQRWK